MRLAKKGSSRGLGIQLIQRITHDRRCAGMMYDTYAATRIIALIATLFILAPCLHFGAGADVATACWKPCARRIPWEPQPAATTFSIAGSASAAIRASAASASAAAAAAPHLVPSAAKCKRAADAAVRDVLRVPGRHLLLQRVRRNFRCESAIFSTCKRTCTHTRNLRPGNYGQAV